MRQIWVLHLFPSSLKKHLMKNYEVTFIVDPVLSPDEIKATARKLTDYLKKEGCKIVYVDVMGSKQLAYPIKKRQTGHYFCVEFQSETGEIVNALELIMRRDERLLRFLTVSLDKYGVKYNMDKRDGKIGKVKKKPKPQVQVAASQSKRKKKKKRRYGNRPSNAPSSQRNQPPRKTEEDNSNTKKQE